MLQGLRKIWKHLTFDITQESFLLEKDGTYVSAGTLACPKGSLAYEEKTSLDNNLVINQNTENRIIRIQEENSSTTKVNECSNR